MTQINRPASSAKKSCKKSIALFATEKLEALDAKGLRRTLNPTARSSQSIARRKNQNLISFSDNDYLGLSTDPRVIDAGISASKRYGAGSGASRLVTGDNPLNAEIETKLSAMKGTEAALLFGSGYLANVGTIPTLVGKGDVILLDALVHSCIHAGARLSGAEIQIFRHNDIDHARTMLEQVSTNGNILVITETVFSMDGDCAPLSELSVLCEKFGAWLMTDDAHGLGVSTQENPAPIQMGTLSKAAGVYGGYVCGPNEFIQLLQNRARSFIYTTGLPPFVLGAINAALDIITREKTLGIKAIDNAKLFCHMLDLPPPTSTIVPLIIGEADAAMAFSTALEDNGFLVTAIRPPTVAAGTARLRFTFSANHREEDIKRLVGCINEVRAA